MDPFKSLRRLVLAGLLGLAFLPVALALSPPPPLGVGDQVPPVSVRDAEGQPVALRSLLAEAPAVLIFYRGGWCPFCVRQLGGLAEIEGDIRAAGYRLHAISPDSPEKLRAKPALAELSYTLFSDSKVEAITAFHLGFKVPDELVAKYKNDYHIDLEADSGETHHILPHPAVYVVDREGVVRFAHVDPDYKKRLEPEKILEALKAE
jgi:peroxiredoxin